MNEANPVVLVVDDEVQIRRFLRAGLELDGFSVQDAETGADALRWATLKPPDLVILDLVCRLLLEKKKPRGDLALRVPRVGLQVQAGHVREATDQARKLSANA